MDMFNEQVRLFNETAQRNHQSFVEEQMRRGGNATREQVAAHAARNAAECKYDEYLQEILSVDLNSKSVDFENTRNEMKARHKARVAKMEAEFEAASKRNLGGSINLDHINTLDDVRRHFDR